MVNEKILVRDKHASLKKVLIFLIIIVVIGIVISVVFYAGYFMEKPKNIVVIENPLKGIVFANTNVAGEVNKEKVVEEAIIEFNAEYINYLLAAMGVNNLHSMIGYGNPIIEFSIDQDTWTTEVDDGALITTKATTDNKDLRIILSKEEAVNALLSSDIENFMKQSVTNGNTQIEMVAGKVELAAKGYLGMYQQITGDEIEVE
ncbi:MAG: hypothetical protein ABIH37_05410 [archaeon]